MKTVFFGPFIGEFGWELSWWHGWVKKMCRTKYKDYKKVVCSFDGRSMLYPDADVFLGHNLKGITRGYRMLDMTEPELLLKDYKKEFKNATYYIPWKLNIYDKKFIGLIWSPVCKIPKTISPPLEDQIFEKLEWETMLSSAPKIAILPRYIDNKRPDRAWSKEKWDELIKWLRLRYLEHEIGIIGTTGGCHYTKDTLPDGIMSLIDKPLHYQVGWLNKCDFAVGSESGAMRMVDLAGCPSVEFGLPETIDHVKEENVLKTRKVYWPRVNPPVSHIELLIRSIMEGYDHLQKHPEIKLPPWWRRGFYKKHLLSLTLRELIIRPKLWVMSKKS